MFCRSQEALTFPTREKFLLFDSRLTFLFFLFLFFFEWRRHVDNIHLATPLTLIAIVSEHWSLPQIILFITPLKPSPHKQVFCDKFLRPFLFACLHNFLPRSAFADQIKKRVGFYSCVKEKISYLCMTRQRKFDVYSELGSGFQTKH